MKVKNSSKKYTSERQAIIYELAEKQWIEIWNNPDFISFVKKKKKEIDSLLDNIGDEDMLERDYNKAVLEYRDKNELYKEIPLSQLLQIFSIHQNEKAYSRLGINPEKVLKLPSNKILNDKSVNEGRGVIRMDDLESSQSENKYGYSAELLSNAIDASISGGSIWRFGEGFLQVIDKIKQSWSKIIVSTKTKDNQWYDIFLTKKNMSQDWNTDLENYFSSTKNTKTEHWTSVRLQKEFSEQEQKEIKKYLFQKFKTNSRAEIIFNWKVLNNLWEYKYINWEDLDMSAVPVVEVKLSGSEFEFIDHWIWMSANTIVNKLLKPNSTWNARKKLSGEEVLEVAPHQTKFFYKPKNEASEKTNISLNIAWVSIENFNASTFWNIWDFTLEFPISSALKDSRNEIDISKEVSIAMKVSLEKIEEKSESLEEKLALLEIVGLIYERLKERPSNLVDEQFVLSTVLKKGFQGIRKDLEKNWITVLPADKNLIDNLWYPENTFYISQEFVDFDIKNIRDKKEIERVSPTTIQGSFVWEKYSFYEVEFKEDANYDYFVHSDTIFIDSHLLEGKTTTQRDEIIMWINVWVNQNTWYQWASTTIDYWRILTSWEEFVQNNKQKIWNNNVSQTAKKWEKISQWKEWNELEKIEKQEIEKNKVLQDLDTFRKKYKSKIAVHSEWSNFWNLKSWVTMLVTSKDYDSVKDKIICRWCGSGQHAGTLSGSKNKRLHHQPDFDE